jgi:hypothetical protein
MGGDLADVMSRAQDRFAERNPGLSRKMRLVDTGLQQDILRDMVRKPRILVGRRAIDDQAENVMNSQNRTPSSVLRQYNDSQGQRDNHSRNAILPYVAGVALGPGAELIGRAANTEAPDFEYRGLLR